MSRSFEDTPAVREATPLLVGLIGPSGTGKTYSALRLATGIARVDPGPIFMIDTEARRGLHYADEFDFRHVHFDEPFSPLDYLAAIQHCVERGAKTIIVDSMSHEHEGPGGVLELHAKELERLTKGDVNKQHKMTMLAWGPAKRDRRRLINTIIQIRANFVFCFRAKEKVRLEKGKDPEKRGWQPLAGDEFVYEMVLRCLLLPGADGVPTWTSDKHDELELMKRPKQFREVLTKGVQLSEEIGMRLAEWASGEAPPDVEGLIARYVAGEDPASVRVDVEKVWKRLKRADRERLADAAKAATNAA